ncbi:hypothetical protein KDL44_14795 [bacterium]|nr:hypothetical protein [bacterium]
MNIRLRLGLARIHWKHSLAFRFAHRPLCPRYRADLLRVRGIWLCRSCCLLWLGIVSGNLIWLLPLPQPSVSYAGGYMAVLATVAILSFPAIYRPLPRLLRDLLRFSAGLLIAATPFVAIRLSLATGIIGAVLILLFRQYYLRSALRRRQRVCTDCPAGVEQPVCDGFSQQVEGLRRYEEEATEFLYTRGYVPPGL